ncbi:HU family DNA-binding protein [Rhizosaccharibacter radicis]|uniref:HU family DNA-binding protein n=1 Tax=Rhizosaccharibacter radicis TaxID=2782605 RepID=A0ABT1VSD9_9PROT|nr:HU family DNA-binding protein [Acetobacteraceae bacterium KSS12]
MNQADLVAKVATGAELTKESATKAVDAIVQAVAEALKAGEEVRLSGLGIFDVSSRAARQGRNPQTGESIEIAASKAVRFRAGKALKDSVNSAPAPKAAPAKAAAKPAPKAAPKKK